MIVIFALLVVLLVAIIVTMIGALLYLIHCTIIDVSPNYEYHATKGRIEKVTYGDSSVKFLCKKNIVFGIPFFWSLEREAYSYNEAKEYMDRQLQRISDKRVIKKQILK